jgi:hypothetical protein
LFQPKTRCWIQTNWNVGQNGQRDP